MFRIPPPPMGATSTDLALAALAEEAAAEGDGERFFDHYLRADDAEGKETPLTEPSDTRFIAVIFGKDATEIEVKYLYRGDARAPDTIPPEGFMARGTNTNLLRHLVDPSTSGFVSTSTSKAVAREFPKSIGTGFVYEINPQKNAIDVVKTFQDMVKVGELEPKDIHHFSHEQEMAIPSQIRRQDIKGAWPIDALYLKGDWVRVTRNASFIPNPDYVPFLSPTYQTLSKIAKGAGVAAAAVGGVVDGLKLCSALEKSTSSGNFSPFFNEGARVISAWGAAAALGTSLGGAGAEFGGAIAGPYGALLGGVVGGVGGSVLGYLGGEKVVTQVNHALTGVGAPSIGDIVQRATDSLPMAAIIGTTPTEIAILAHASEAQNHKKKKDTMDCPPLPDIEAPKTLLLAPEPPTPPHHSAKKVSVPTPHPQPNYNALHRSQLIDTYFAQQFGAPRYSLFDNLNSSRWSSQPSTFSPYSATQAMIYGPPKVLTFEGSQPSSTSSAMQALIYGPPKVLTFGHSQPSTYSTYSAPRSELTFGHSQPSSTYSATQALIYGPPKELTFGQSQPSTLSTYSATRPELSFGAYAFGPLKGLTFGHDQPSSTYSATQVENAFRFAMNMAASNDGAFDVYLSMSLHLSMSSIGACKDNFSYRAFTNLLRSTNLVSSYNNTHGSLQSMRILSRVMAEIGGVAVDVGIIKGLRNSVEDVLCEQAFISMRLRYGDMPLPVEPLRQLIRELAQGILVHKAYPFFSLHFNRDHELYPVLHPAYQQTLVGEVCGFLDYFMKGFLNGGAYSAEFLRHWHETRNHDREYLKQNLVDIKALAKAAGLPYLSLRELMYREGLKDYDHTDKFRTSFRIIAEQGKVHQHGHVFSVTPNFRVEHSIDLMPDYQEYLRVEAQKEQDPAHPYISDDLKKHRRLVRAYQQMAVMIKEIMPLLPMFTKDFQTLGIISFLSYYITTLNDMGRQLDLPQAPKVHTDLFPPVLPAIPVRYYQFYPVHLNFAELLEALGAADSPSRLEFDAYCRQLAKSERPPFPDTIKTTIQHYLQAQLPPTTPLDDEYLAAVCLKITVKLAQLTQVFLLSTVKELNRGNELSHLDGPLFEALDEETRLVEEKAARWSQLLQEKKTLTEATRVEKKQAITALFKEMEDEAVANLQQQLAAVRAKPVPAGYIRNEAGLMQQFNQQLAAITSDLATELAAALTSMDEELEHNIGLLQSIIDDCVTALNQFGQAILERESLRLIDMTKQRYEHSTLDIADRDYYETQGDNLTIVGGCGLNLSSMTPLPLSEEKVAALLSPEVMAVENERFVLTESGGQRTATMKLPIRFQPVTDWTEQTELLVDVLSEEDSPPTPRDPHGRYPIHFAAEVGDTAAIESLLASEPECLDAKTATHLTPLMVAAQAGQTKAALFLLAKGANPNHSLPNGLTAVFLAAQSGFEDTAIAIVENSAITINAVNEDDVNILHVAFDLGYERLALAAIAKGVDVVQARKTDGLTPMHYAAKEGMLPVLEQMLLVPAIQLATPLPSGETLLHLAVESGNQALVERLLEAQKPLLLMPRHDGETPLMRAIRYSQHEIALLLIESYPEHSQDINAQNAQGQTALILAAKAGAYRVTKELLEEHPQVDVSIKDKQERNAAYYLLCQGAFSHYQDLHRAGKVHVDDEYHGQSSLAITLEHGHFLLADYLQAEGARYDATPKADAKTIECYVKHDQLPALKAYLKKVHPSEIDHETCLSLAAESGSEACYAYLIGSERLSDYQRMDTIPKLMRQSSVKNVDCFMKEMHRYYQYAAADELAEFAHCAVQSGNMAMIPHLPQYGVSFVTKNEEGLTPLHLAIQADDVEMLKLLLTYVKKEDVPSELQSYASRLEKHACSRYLWKHYHEQHAESAESDAVFIKACESGNAAKVERLLPQYVHLKASPNPMRIAISQGHYFVAKLLLEHGFATRGFPDDETHALRLSAKYNNVEMIFLLLQNGFTREPGYYTVPNAYARKAVYRGDFTSYHAAKEELLTALQSANLRTIRNLIVEQKFPIDTALFLFQGKLRPFLHCAFMLHYEAAIALVSRRVDPLRKAEGGIPLIDAIVDYHSPKENEQLPWIQRYFPEQAERILTQTEDSSPDVTALAQAIALDNTILVTQLLRAGFPSQSVGDNQQPPLHLAAAKGSMEVIQAALASGVEINLLDAQGRTPLMAAARMGQVGAMAWLIQHGANPDLTDRYGNLALHLAIAMKKDEAALYLFDRTRAIDHPNRRGESPFLLAVKAGLPNVVDHCLHRPGINLHRVNDKGHTALCLAVRQLPILQTLINSKAHFTPAEFQDALQQAAGQGIVSTFTYLADYGVRIDKLDDEKCCAITIALAGGNEDMVRALRQYSAFYEPRLQTNMLLSAVQENRLFAIRELLSMGVPVNAQHQLGVTALAVAAQHDAIQSAQLLLQQHADPHITCVNGWTPLHYAAQAGSLGAARLLLAHHARLDALNLEGKTPIDVARTNQQEAILALCAPEPPQAETVPAPRYKLPEIASKSDLLAALEPLLDSEAAMHHVSSVFSGLSIQSLELCLLGLQHVEASQQRAMVLQWAQWLESLPANIVAKMDHALLSKYPWHVVMGEPLMDVLQHAHLDYFWDFVEPIKIIRLEKEDFEAQLAAYQELSKELKFPIQSKYPLYPLQRGISFTVDKGEYLQRMIFALKTTYVHWLQVKYLSELPGIAVMEDAKSSGIWFFCRDTLNPPDTDWATNLARGGAARMNTEYALDWQAYSAAMQYQNVTTHRLSSEEIDYIYRSHYHILSWVEDPRYATLFLSYAEQIRDRLGYPVFRAFFERHLCGSAPGEEKVFLEVFQSMLALEGEADLLAILTKIRSESDDIYQFDEALKAEEAALLARRFPEKPLADVIQAFRTVKEPLAEDELIRIEALYPLVEKTFEEHRQDTPEALLEAMRTRADALRIDTTNLALRCELFGLLSIAMKNQFNKKPYRTQLIALLALTEPDVDFKGRIAEILTGEGKSMILTLLIAFYALQGEQIDMISSSKNLVLRDQKENEAFFNSIGVTTGIVCYQDPTPEHFKAQVLYGTSTDFEFPLLREMLYGETLRGDRPYDRAISDEVDHLFISLGLTPAILAMPAARDMSFVYKPIFDYVQAAGSEAISPLELKTHLLTLLTGKEAELILSLDEAVFLKWIRSAMQALIYEEKVHYIVKSGKITIMDIGTGRESEGTRWQHGVHAFVEIKHGLTPRSESLTAASISHPAFFAEYRKMSGVTGTMGLPVEREEIKALYGVKSFDVPPNRPSQRIQLDTQFALTKEEHAAGLLAQAKAAATRGQAVLILFRTIKNSETFSAYLQTKNEPHTVLNTQQQEGEDYLIALAGLECQITIATNTAGRGVDIKTENLHVIFADFPEDTRELAQGFGRAGRQGQPGSCELFLWRDDPLVKELMPIDEIRHQFPALALDIILNGNRAERIAYLSAQRLKTAGQVTVQYELLKRFCTIVKNHAEQLEKTTLEDFVAHLTQSTPFLASNAFFKDNVILKPALQRLSRYVLAEESSMADQTVLFEQLKEVYLLSLGQMWGEFFSQLNKDKSQDIDVGRYRENSETQFAAFMAGDVSAYLSHAPGGFYHFVQQLRAEVRASSPLAAARQRFGFMGGGAAETALTAFPRVSEHSFQLA